MRLQTWIWALAALASLHAELQCEWEERRSSYLSGWAVGHNSRWARYDTLDEAKEVCIKMGANCGGITLMNNGYSLREGKEFVANNGEHSYRKTCMGVPLFRVNSISPGRGSRVGGTRITISGQGFSTNQFGYDDPSLGNKVTFYHKDNVHPPVQCHVQTYYTSPTRIVCDMAKPDVYWGSELEYRMKLSVDGTWMSQSGTNIFCGSVCRFYFDSDNTPYISSVESRHVAAGSVLTMKGRMWTDNFEPSVEVSADSDFISRVFLNSFTCDPSDSNGISYGTDLDKDDDGVDTNTGSIMCKSKSPGASSYRPSFLHSKWGRSEVRSNINRVDSKMRKYAFQTYNVLDSVSPVEGSTSGGTKVTITSEHVVGPANNIKAEVGGEPCTVESFTTGEVVCSTSPHQDKTLYPGNRGITVEYWSKEDDVTTDDARRIDPDLIRAFTQDAENFLFEKYIHYARPESLQTVMDMDSSRDEPYYVRAKFFISIQETDLYGFHMISDHSGKLYVSTDHDPANAVLVAECENVKNTWNLLQTDVDTTLEAGKIYYVEFVGVMWRYNQRFGVGLTKKNTPYQTYDVDISRKEYPYWYWKQEYNDEVQEIDLGDLITTPQTGFKLQLGDRQTETLYASSTPEQISAAITETSVYKCPAIESAEAWYSVDFENGDASTTGGSAAQHIEPYCGRGVGSWNWVLFHVNYNKRIYEWDPNRGFPHLCFAIKTLQTRVSLYYELDYEDSSFRWRRQGFWRGADSVTEFADNDGTWKYNCIDMVNRVEVTDYEELWQSRIGNRKWKVRRVLLGVDEEYYTDSLRIVRTPLAENGRVVGFPLTGDGLLEDVVVTSTDYCGEEACTDENISEATSRKWKIAMNTFGCGYDFPFIKIAGQSGTVVTANTETRYTVGGKAVVIKRETSITPDLQGTFDLTIDGVTHTDIPVHVPPTQFVEILSRAGEYSAAHMWGTCYERHWRLERKYSGHHGWHEIDSTNVVGVGEVTTTVMYRDGERGGLVMTPLIGDWIRTAHAKPQVALKVDGIQAFCELGTTCDYTPSEAQTPTVASVSPTSGSRGASITLTGTGFGTDAESVTVSVGGVTQTVSGVTDTTVTFTLGDGVARLHSADEIIVNVAGKGNAAMDASVSFTYVGSLSVTPFTPNTGGIGGGTLVQVTGSGFDPENAGVTFAGTAGQVQSATYNEINVIAPAGTEGVAAVAITGGAGFIAPETVEMYTYSLLNVPTISSITPTSGSVVGGTKVTITGVNFNDISEAKIGGVICTPDPDEVSSDTTYYCITGGNSAGRHLVTMVKNSGEMAQSTTEFNHLLRVTDIKPLQGSSVGGTTLTITGTGFGDNGDDIFVDVGGLGCDVESVENTKILCKTQPWDHADQWWDQAVATPTCVASQPTGSDKAAQDAHNIYRRRHGDTPDLCHSALVRTTAASWAAHLAEHDLFQSSTTSYRENRGENLMIFEEWELRSDETYVREAIRAWYAEGSQYSASDPSRALRYTQVVWSLTKEVGCAVETARAAPTDKYKVYVVCHYAAAGNTEGNFGAYVKNFDTAHHMVVPALSSLSLPVTVYLDTRKAPVVKSDPSYSESCTPVYDQVSRCNDAAPTAAEGADFPFAYYTCSTPYITTVTRQVYWDEQIRIEGRGFGSQPCAVTVMLGSEHSCTVTAVSDTLIRCTADISTEPPMYTLFEAKVNILGKGDAIFMGEEYEENAYTSLMPRVSSISPNTGSLEGGLSVVMTGGGFKYNSDNMFTGSVTDGVSEFEILSGTYTSVTVRSPSGITETVDTPKTLVMTQDTAEVECTSCVFTYRVNKTPTITAVTKEAKDPGPGWTISITGTKICDGGTGTTVSIGSSSCTIDTCTSTSVTCSVDDQPAGTYNVHVMTKYGYPTFGEDLNRLEFVYSLTSVEPTSGSVHGGTVITFTGTGLPSQENLKVSTSSYRLHVLSRSTTQIIAKTPDRKITTDDTNQIRFNDAYVGTMYSYSTALSPTVTAVSPAEGTYDTEITITGENFLNADGTTSDTTVLLEPRNPAKLNLVSAEQSTTHSAGHEAFKAIDGDTNGNSGAGSCMHTQNTGSNWWQAELSDGEFAISKIVIYNRQDCCTGRIVNAKVYVGDTLCGRVLSSGAKSTVLCHGSVGNTVRITHTNYIHVCEVEVYGDRPGADNTCEVSSVTATEIRCTLPHAAAREIGFVVKVDPLGYSNTDQAMNYTMVLGATEPASPTSGSLGGPVITLTGSGFPFGLVDPSLNVTVCGISARATLVSTSEISVTLPACPDDVCTDPSHTCDIEVERYDTTLTKAAAVTYNSADTPTITNIDPTDAGTGGGKTITITGTSFTDQQSDVMVSFDGVPCTVVSASTTQIQCTTGAKVDKSNKAGVEVRISDSLALNPQEKTMMYMDKWSSRFTWGGDEANKPVEGDMAVLTEGQIIYLDESPPKLRALLLRGGHLVFDDNQDLILKADYILILNGGSITIGTEDTPFQHEAIIEMYGNQQSIELPMYGAKTLAVRNGTVDMHGLEVTPPWTELGETADAGATSIVVNTETNWKAGDQIALSSSSFAPEENEEFLITNIDFTDGRTTLTLNNPLKYKHISMVQTINGVEVRTAAKVGHLTRNVKMRGNVNTDHLEAVDACPQTFDPDQFATQTCYQGRYGAMMDSDQFGSQIMFHAAAMETREVHGRLENVEFSWAGQAFRLGRYPIHFHMNGDVSGSYVKGCAIHHTFNRAVTVHGVNNLLVKNNVAFNNLGHAFFLEDGGEEDNVFEGNLAIFTQSSSSLLNVDVTPASFWIVNPRNSFINNVAAGSTHFGFWFNMPQHPGGPSATNTICPRNMGMKEFRGNEAHSCGRYGIWVWEFWNPRGDGSCEATAPNMTTLHDFHGWHNLRGVEIETGSGIAMENFLLHDNWFSQMEVHKCFDATFDEGNTRMTGSQIIAKTASSDGMQLMYTGETFRCGTGVVLPGKGSMSVYDSDLHEFTECPAFSACGGCKDRQGGFPNEFRGITYHNSPVRGKFGWEFEVIMRDLDGTLSGNNVPNSIITPNMDILDEGSCQRADDWSHGAVEGAVCDSNTNLVRLAWNEPSISELHFKEVILTNSHGAVNVPWVFKRMTHKRGWMATVPTGETYSMRWDTDLQFTNASFKMSAYYPKDGDYLIIEQTLADKPDYITVGGSSNKKLEPIDGATDDPGTFTFDDETKKLSHLITGKGVTVTQTLPMDLKVYKCFYENCTDPHPKPLPSNPTLLQRPETPKRWSVSSDWMGTEAGLGGHNGILPRAGDKVVIPSSWWMIYDAQMEGLGDIMVYGVLEFSNEEDTVLGANRIIVVGGKLVVGWGDEPLTVKAHIKLTGSRDDSEYTLNDGTNVGSKALAVVGYTEMHSVVPDVLHSTLTERAEVGATTITIKDNVQDKWKVGDEIAIASTSFIPDQAEKRTITQVEGHTLTLDSALEHVHDYRFESIHEHEYVRTAEVILLTRLITIEGVMDPSDTSLYGGRMLVSDYSQINDEGEREEYIPVAQIMGVQFKNCGQRGYRDYYDPRYALALQNTQPGESSYVKSCSVDVSHNHAIGIIGSHNVEVSGNVIYHTRGSGILTNSENTEIVDNVVVYMRSYGNWETPVEHDNYYMDACFETYETNTASLKDNRCGGSERAGFSTQGEESTGTFWQNNVAHSCLWGIFIRRGDNEVTKLNKVHLWQNYDYGVMHWSKSSLIIQDSILADNGFSIFNMVVGPNPLGHELGNKYVEYRDTLIYGRNPDSPCDERQTDVNPTAMLTGIGYYPPIPAKGGRLGMYLSNFMGGWSGWPKMSIQNPFTYSSIKGLTTISGVVFANFDRCNDVAIGDLRTNGDCFHPTKLSDMKYSGVDMENNLLHMNNPSIGFVNSADCVDMPCDAKKKILIEDTDGTTLGAPGTLTSRAEFEWDGDQRWGMGDYRLPNTMTTALDGSKIQASTWPDKGIDRTLNGEAMCQYMTNYNMYKCAGVKYKMLIIESMDGDTELRRLSPIALSTDEGSVDLINGPMDHGWCGGYTCQQRISTFYALVIVGKEYKLHLTSTQPQSMRYMLIDAAAGDKIKLDIWYAKSQRLDVYYRGSYKAPTNAQRKPDGTYSYATDRTAEELYPTLSDAPGTNFFDSKAHWMSMLIKGPDPFTIKTSPKIVLSLTLDTVDGSDFFDEDQIIDNLAALLGVPKNKIKIAKIVAEGRRKRSGQEFQIEISEPPIEDEESMDVGTVTEMATALTEASEKFVETVQKGELGAALNAEVRSVAVQLPEIPPADMRNMTIDQDEAAKVTETTYADRMAQEEAVKAENSASVPVLIPNSLKLITASQKVAVLSNLEVRSKVVTSDERVVPLLGAGEKKWRATVEVVDGPKNGRILGTNQITFANGYGNLTDVRVSRKGEYKFKLSVSYPEDLGHKIEDITMEITDQDKDSPLKRVLFKFDGNYEDIVGENTAEFTAYMKAKLKAKFPDYEFEDIDHYTGSLIVETTVSTNSNNKEDTQAAVTKIREDTEGDFNIDFNGRQARMVAFSGDASGDSGGSNTVAIVVPIVVIVLFAGLAAGGFVLYKKKQNRVSESVHMSKIKNVEADPTLTRQPDGSNIYSNRAADNVACESAEPSAIAVAKQPLAKIAGSVARKQESLKNLRRRSIQKALVALNRLEEAVSDPRYNPVEMDQLDDICISEPVSRESTFMSRGVTSVSLGQGDDWREIHNEVTECEACGETKKTWPCPICAGPRYCSKACLDRDWAEHQNHCRSRSRNRGAALQSSSDVSL